MITEIRTYTISKGQMDAFLTTFWSQMKPLYDRIGIKIVAAWVDRRQNEFIWIRVFDDKADQDAKNQAFRESPERLALGDSLPIAKIEVKELTESVITPEEGVAGLSRVS